MPADRATFGALVRLPGERAGGGLQDQFEGHGSEFPDEVFDHGPGFLDELDGLIDGDFMGRVSLFQWSCSLFDLTLPTLPGRYKGKPLLGLNFQLLLGHGRTEYSMELAHIEVPYAAGGTRYIEVPPWVHARMDPRRYWKP